MSGVYVLKLENEKYYVGWSNNMQTRIDQHFDKKGSQWTQTHAPISVVEKMLGGTKKEEMLKTLEYMSIYGLNNVRGGPWATTQLDEEPTRLMRHLNDECYNCGSKRHLVVNCRKKPEAKTEPATPVSITKQSRCVRCGKSDHQVSECIEPIDIHGKKLDAGPVCFKCGKKTHYANRCRVKSK